MFAWHNASGVQYQACLLNLDAIFCAISQRCVYVWHLQCWFSVLSRPWSQLYLFVGRTKAQIV